MGGADKGLATMYGQPMAAWVLERIRHQVGCILINANRNIEHWRAFGVPVIGDTIEGFLGPLAGIHAGLTACTTRWMQVVPCDSPFIPIDLTSRLARQVEKEHASIAVVRTDSGLQPVFALIDRNLLPSLESYLRAGSRKIDRWYESVAAVAVDFEDAEAFANINTQQELELASATRAISPDPI